MWKRITKSKVYLLCESLDPLKSAVYYSSNNIDIT